MYSGCSKSRDVLGSVHPTCPTGCWWTRKLLLAPQFLGHGESKHQNPEKDLNEVNFLSLVSLYAFIDQKEESEISKDRSELCQGYLRTSGGSGEELLSTWPSESVAKGWGVVMLLQCVCPHVGQVWKAGTISYTWWDFEGPMSRFGLWDITQGNCLLRERNHFCEGKTWNYQEMWVSSTFYLRIVQAVPCARTPIISVNISICGSWRKGRGRSHTSQSRQAGQGL